MSEQEFDYEIFREEWNELLGNQEYTECELLCKEGLTMQPIEKYRGKLYNHLGYLYENYLDNRTFDDILEQYVLALQYYDENAAAHYNLANFLLEQGMQHLTRALEVNPTHRKSVKKMSGLRPIKKNDVLKLSGTDIQLVCDTVTEEGNAVVRAVGASRQIVIEFLSGDDPAAREVLVKASMTKEPSPVAPMAIDSSRVDRDKRQNGMNNVGGDEGKTNELGPVRMKTHAEKWAEDDRPNLCLILLWSLALVLCLVAFVMMAGFSDPTSSLWGAFGDGVIVSCDDTVHVEEQSDLQVATSDTLWVWMVASSCDRSFDYSDQMEASYELATDVGLSTQEMHVGMSHTCIGGADYVQADAVGSRLLMHWREFDEDVPNFWEKRQNNLTVAPATEMNAEDALADCEEAAGSRGDSVTGPFVCVVLTQRNESLEWDLDMSLEAIEVSRGADSFWQENNNMMMFLTFGDAFSGDATALSFLGSLGTSATCGREDSTVSSWWGQTLSCNAEVSDYCAHCIEFGDDFECGTGKLRDFLSDNVEVQKYSAGEDCQFLWYGSLVAPALFLPVAVLSCAWTLRLWVLFTSG